MSRITDELDLLKRHLGGRCEMRAGTKTVGGSQYIGVLVKSVPVSPTKFDVARSDMLFLLPPVYPEIPPLGVYMNYRWTTADHHFTLQAHYGAPDLQFEGWYWYCVGLGGGFDINELQRSWRPGRAPAEGHNLISIYVAAQYSVSTD